MWHFHAGSEVIDRTADVVDPEIAAVGDEFHEALSGSKMLQVLSKMRCSMARCLGDSSVQERRIETRKWASQAERISGCSRHISIASSTGTTSASCDAQAPPRAARYSARLMITASDPAV